MPFEADTHEKLMDFLDKPCGHSVNPQSSNIRSTDPLKPTDLHESTLNSIPVSGSGAESGMVVVVMVVVVVVVIVTREQSCS